MCAYVYVHVNVSRIPKNHFEDQTTVCLCLCVSTCLFTCVHVCVYIVACVNREGWVSCAEAFVNCQQF